MEEMAKAWKIDGWIYYAVLFTRIISYLIVIKYTIYYARMSTIVEELDLVNIPLTYRLTTVANLMNFSLAYIRGCHILPFPSFFFSTPKDLGEQEVKSVSGGWYERSGKRSQLLHKFHAGMLFPKQLLE
jgi:hypothetical protein